ncbi:hypothetical protein AC1031_014924 [Aphanomyces cochlioides]|nr:hypothetical protein AC1031_014924 [Aphanomyces cochlioides]
MYAVDRDELLELRSAFERTTAGKPSPVKKPSVSGKERVEPNLSREEFNAALESVDFHDSDRAIFDRLFTMLDKTGDDVINSREFLVGVAPLVKGNLSSKIALALDMYDEDSTGEISSAGLRFIVTTVTTIATFFGDPPMTKKDVVALSNAIMDGRDSIEYTSTS